MAQVLLVFPSDEGWKIETLGTDDVKTLVGILRQERIKKQFWPEHSRASDMTDEQCLAYRHYSRCQTAMGTVLLNLSNRDLLTYRR